MSAVGETHAFELLHGEGIAFAARHTLIEQWQCDIFDSVFVADKIE